jgi:hypothetical protein
MNKEQLAEILADIKYEDYQFEIVVKEELLFVQGRYVEADIMTNDPTDQHTRKYYISEHMIVSEVVQTIMLLIKTSMEHRLREHFLYKGQRIYGPHFDVDELVQVCQAKKIDYRGKKKKS